MKANGGGTVTGREQTLPNGFTGFVGNNYFFGRDLNFDGDRLDQVLLLAPSQTRTNRYGVIAGARWDINPNHAIRVSYTLDNAHHRQTGEVGRLQRNGEPYDVFPVNDPLTDLNGNPLEKRDRKSIATLNQIAGEYRGVFGAAVVNVGLRAPFFERKLDNRCFTTSASGFVDCFHGDAAAEAAYRAQFPTRQGPQKRTFKYDKLLPNIGLTYDFTPRIGVFANYAKGLTAPSTDNLYNSFFFAPDTEAASPKPEQTDSFDGGIRYRSSKIQAQLSAWYTKFTDRQAQAFDPELNVSVFRNLGKVDKYGLDGSVAYSPNQMFTFYAFGSVLKSKIRDNIQVGPLPVGVTCDSPNAPIASCAFTEGNYESGSPKYSFGGSGVGHFGPFEVGFTAKRTGPRYIFDTNVPVFAGPIANPTVVFGRTAPAYWLVNMDARFNLNALSPKMGKSYFQLNVYNLFDKFFVGGFSGGLSQSISGSNYGNPPFVSIGAPRAIMGSLNIEF